MANLPRRPGHRRLLVMELASLLCCCAAGFAQRETCPATANKPEDPAEMAFAQGNMADAEDLFQQALLHEPGDPRLIAGMARTRLRLGKLEEAATAVRAAMQVSARSAPLQVALADVQMREGLPWLAQESLSRAAEIDPCFAQLWLVRSRLDRLDSMYATERADIARAYAIDPKDAEIRRSYNRMVTPAKDLASTQEYLRTTKNIDPELRKAAEETVRTTLPLFSETTQTCRGLPEERMATLPLQPSRQDGQHIDGYRTEVAFGQTKVLLEVDTAASGLYISRALADANGLTQKTGDPAGTVHADAVQVGPLTFHDCVVGVSDTPFPGKAAGFMGTDLFAQYLITLNFPDAKLLLRPLPEEDAVLPGDRPQQVAELAGFSPVYHRLQYLLVPVTLNGKERRLFVLDSGIRLSTMTLPVAHLVSTTQRGFTHSFTTVSGATIQTYSDNFDMEFAQQRLHGRGGILQFDPATIEGHAGMRIGGMIGFDILQTAVLQLDYRDGLVRVEFPQGRSTAVSGGSLMAGAGGGKAQESAACAGTLPSEIPAAATIIASNTGLLDVKQMKTDEALSLKVEQPWQTGTCRLERGALVYGRVVSLDNGRGPGSAHLGVAFDRAECFGKGKQPLPLRLVSVVAADSFVGIHTAVPTSIGGGLTRNIGDAVSAVDQTGDDVNINAKAQPRTVKTGSVQGMPAVHLEPAGPACSALLTGAGGTLRLGVGTRWLLVNAQ